MPRTTSTPSSTSGTDRPLRSSPSPARTGASPCRPESPRACCSTSRTYLPSTHGTSPSSVSSRTRCRPSWPTSATTATAHSSATAAANYNDPTLQGFGTLNTNQRRPFFNGPIAGAPLGAQGGSGNFGAPFGWTQGLDFFCNCGKTDYQALQAKVTRQFSNGWSLLAHYTYQKAKNNDGSYFFIDPELNYALNGFSRTHNFVVSALAELPFGKGKRFGSDASGFVEAILGGWQVNTNIFIQSGLPFDVGYAGSGSDRDVGPGRPDLIGDPAGPKTQDQWFNATPIGEAGSAFGRPARGTFGNMERNSLTGPGFWNVDASLFKRFHVKDSSSLEFRIEVVNLFNHVNLGQPNNTVGVPGDPRPSAGRITSTAAQNQMRNLQFALRFQF